jgi:hypothetical protein
MSVGHGNNYEFKQFYLQALKLKEGLYGTIRTAGVRAGLHTNVSLK